MRRARVVVAMLAVLVACLVGGCSVDHNGNDGSQGLSQMHQEADRTGSDLLAQLDGDLAPGQVTPDSRGSSLANDGSLDHGPRYWTWDTQVLLSDASSVTPDEAVATLSARLLALGWKKDPPSAIHPDRTSFIGGTGGDWTIGLTPDDHGPGTRVVDISVQSPVTTKD